MAIHPVILCGGSGTRLWPASRPDRPKQFAILVGSESTFLSTVWRFLGASDFRPPVIVAGDAHRDIIADQLRQAGAEAFLMIEPEARDSAPAIAAAAVWIAGRDPDGIVVVVAADHHIPDPASFLDAARIAAGAARGGAVVTFGVTPSEPSSAYGYIRPGDLLAAGEVTRRVEAFAEKPDRATAQRYVKDGYLWNSGNFVFHAGLFLEELERHAPDVLRAARAAVLEGPLIDSGMTLGPSFKSAPKISIDYAVMEKTANAAVIPVRFEWSDLGAWDAVLAASERDEAGNATAGEPVLIDVEGCLIRAADGMRVAAVGASNLAIIVERDSVLVCDLSKSQQVKEAAGRVGHFATAMAPLVSPALDLDRWMRASALPLWWALGADHAHGGFHESIDQQGRPLDLPRRLRVQARQVYAYATALEQGWTGPAADAVQHGLDYMEGRYRRPDGLYRTLVGADGEPLDDTAMLYDQAFVLLGLASAFKACGRPKELSDTAEALVARIAKTQTHPAGGFVEASNVRPFQANPHMHLLEAALAWEAAGGDKAWAALADSIVELALARFIDPQGGFLREFFNAAWRPAPGPDGRLLEPGHQFEWAWLLERWARLRGREDASLAAGRLFEAGLKGVDRRGNVAIDAMRDDFFPLAETARLWPQTERLKAARILARHAPSREARDRFDAEARAAQAGLEPYLATPVQGLWRDKLDARSAFVDEPAPASSLYHLMAAAGELAEPLRAASRQGDLAPQLATAG